MKVIRIVVKVVLITSLMLLSILSISYVYINSTYKFDTPDFKITRTQNASGYLEQNEFGVWELYIEGSPYNRGLVYGELTADLMKLQEDVFVVQLIHFVPNKYAQKVILTLITFFNRDLITNIPDEYVEEIYGVSQFFSDEYNFVMPKFMRILNYHAAHDLGHALNDYSVVGCTSVGVIDTTNSANRLLIGRNFDFYVGDEFSKEKLITFMRPEEGYAFASYSWAGFMGVVSGMNETGLSVTINAAKSKPPTSAKTPISILTRDILQYCSTIEEAIAIAEKHEVFVSESIMVGSKEDGTVAIIEKSPNGMGVYNMEGNRIICSNHYQSDEFAEDPMNLSNIEQSESASRYTRVEELVPENGVFSIEQIAEVLRDQYDVGGDTLGMGNPKALNQLQGHHAVVFDNYNTTMYITTQNWQLGEFIGYNLKDVFETGEISISDTISKSPFLDTPEFELFITHKEIDSKIKNCINSDDSFISEEEIALYISSNSESFATYEVLGSYYLNTGQTSSAISMLELALTKNLPSDIVKDRIESKISLNKE